MGGFAEIGTLVALLATAAVAYLAYRANEKTRRHEQILTDRNQSAELIRAESEAWKSLIETLTRRYDDSQKETVALATQLRDAHGEAVELQEQWRQLQLSSSARVRELEEELESAHKRHEAALHALGLEIQQYTAEIHALKREVRDLRALLPETALKRHGDSS